MNENPFDRTNAFALTVGIGKRAVDNPAMATTVKDTQRIEEELKGRGKFLPGNVLSLYDADATVANLLAKMDKLADLTKDTPANLVIIYFSGHGCAIAGKYYMVCNDTVNETVETTGISADVFTQKLKTINAGNVLVLLDCCHSGGFAGAFDANTLVALPNRVIISASHASEVSFVSTPYSVFTYALVEGLAAQFFEGDDKNVKLFDLAMYLRERVSSLSDKTQHPQLNIVEDNATSNFSIIRYPKGLPPAPPFEVGFSLKDSSDKDINTSGTPERDEEFRAKFNWISIIGNDNIVVNDVAGDVTISKTTTNNYYYGAQQEENRQYNEYLIWTLMPAIKGYSLKAKAFMDNNESNPKWNKEADTSGLAKDAVASSYVGVLGIELRKLFSIGNGSAADKKKQYIEKCITIARKTLQLMCFSMISDIYTQKKEKDFILTADQSASLKIFFEYANEVGFTIEQLKSLLITLYSVYTSFGLTYTISQLEGLSNSLQSGSDFIKACDELTRVNKIAEEDKITLLNCDITEVSLTNILAPLGFLAGYSMASVKSVNYEDIVSTSANYLHSYIKVSDANSSNNAALLNYANATVNTDSVVMYSGAYTAGIKASINLFPFVIDLSALNMVTGLMVCFYNSICVEQDDNGENVDKLRFLFSEDDSKKELVFSGLVDSNPKKINDLVNIAANRIIIKTDSTFLQFREIKKKLLGITGNDQ